MQKLPYIIPECFVDTNVVQTLIQRKGVNHQMTCSQVISSMSKGKLADEFAVGIIDADKKEPPSIKDFNTIIGKSQEITLLKKSDKPHYLIKINNIMENFLLNCAKEIKFDMNEIGISPTLDGMKKITKNRSSQNNPIITKLVKELNKSSQIRLLTSILCYLIDNRYNAKDDELKRLF